MKRTAKRLAAITVPVAALILAAGGTASANADDDFLESSISASNTGYEHSSANPWGAQATGAGTQGLQLTTGEHEVEDDD